MPRGLLRHSGRDAWFVGLAAAQGALLLLAPSGPLIALGLWWNSNTIAHNAVHKPFFRSRALNRLFALYETILLGIPQSIWRGRHLAHHAGKEWRARLTTELAVELAVELALVLGVWGALLWLAPAFFLGSYVPGYAAGLALCWLHGHYEHARGTESHYGSLYNLLFFNDGFHIEHHERPGAHWSELPGLPRAASHGSVWPAVLRWLETPPLEVLERAVLRSRWLQRFVLVRHERAFRQLLPSLPCPSRVAIVGGALFPRTALILHRLLPGALLVVIDESRENIDRARLHLPAGAETVQGRFDPEIHRDFDLVVVPLSLNGSRAAFYVRPPAPAVLVHDWIWRRRGVGVKVSWLLLKRMNLVRGVEPMRAGGGAGSGEGRWSAETHHLKWVLLFSILCSVLGGA